MKREAGFTLTEVMLVLIISSILLSSAVLLYGQLRNSSGHTAAWKKVIALQIVVEDMVVAKDGKYPSIDEVREVWKIKRPNDYNMSPWGGQAIGNGAVDGIIGGDLPAGDHSTHANQGDSGILYYYRQTNPTTGGLMIFSDRARGGEEMGVRFYMVSIADETGERYFYLNGPYKADPNAQQGDVEN